MPHRAHRTSDRSIVTVSCVFCDGQEQAAYNAAARRSQSVRKMAIRAVNLSFAGTMTHGALSVLVRSTMSQTARS